MTKYFSLRYLKLWLMAALLCSFIFASAVTSAATLLSQSYIAKEKLPAGSIVSLQKSYIDRVESATLANANYILGVVIDDNSSQLSISSSEKNQVNVAISGVEQVLVSDINGNIEVGDPITASPVDGVGMKASNNVKVIGIAQDTFPNSSAKEQEYNDKKGQKQNIKIGNMPTLVNVAYYYKQPDKTIIPSAIQSIANALAGKKVNPLPILISLGIFIVTMLIVVSVVYSMIHSSIISVGRNPMSQAAVYRNVIQLSGLVILILGVAVGTIYMVLTRF